MELSGTDPAPQGRDGTSYNMEPAALRTAPSYAMPSREVHETRTGLKPIELHADRKFYGQAKAAIQSDLGTIRQLGAASAWATLDAVCESVHHEADLPLEDIVFYDPELDRFWIFPGKHAAQNA